MEYEKELLEACKNGDLEKLEKLYESPEGKEVLFKIYQDLLNCFNCNNPITHKTVQFVVNKGISY